MDTNESRPLDWKTCIRKSFAPHLLNPSDNQERSNFSLNPLHIEQPNNAHHNFANPELDSVDKTPFLGDPEKTENVKKDIISSIMVKSAYIDATSQSFIGISGPEPQNRKNYSENPIDSKEDIEDIITADAEKLAKSFKILKIKKKKNRVYRAESSQKAPNWNSAIKKVLGPKSLPESSLKAPKECEVKDPDFWDAEILESEERNPWTYHKLTKDDCQAFEDDRKVRNKSPSKNYSRRLTKNECQAFEDDRKVRSKSPSKYYSKKRYYTKEEEKAMKILQSARRFKAPKNPHLNVFDGAGVNCFKKSEIKSNPNMLPKNAEQPKRVPPPGGYVCVKPLTAEDIKKGPVNVIFSECWDYDEDEW